MPDKSIAIIDYGAGNLRSVANAVTSLGYPPTITSSPDEVLAASAVILPGVGAAADTMRNLAATDMSRVIRQLISEERPLFAVCMGMQVMLEATEEGGWHQCLGIVPGTVRKLRTDGKIPHMGWNQVKQKITHPVFDNIPDKASFYFVHSYYADPEDASVIAGTTDYGVSFCSVMIQGSLVATQFHPEKSGEHGLRMYANFLRMALKGRS